MLFFNAGKAQRPPRRSGYSSSSSNSSSSLSSRHGAAAGASSRTRRRRRARRRRRRLRRPDRCGKKPWFPAKLDINNLIPGAFYRAAAAAPGGRAGEGGAAAAAAAAGAADRPRQDKLLQQVVLRADTAGARMLISRMQTSIQNWFFLFPGPAPLLLLPGRVPAPLHLLLTPGINEPGAELESEGD